MERYWKEGGGGVLVSQFTRHSDVTLHENETDREHRDRERIDIVECNNGKEIIVACSLFALRGIYQSDVNNC